MEQSRKYVPKTVCMIKGLIISYLITGAALLILALLLLKMQLKPEAVSLGITVIYVLSCISGGFFVGKVTKEHKFLWGILLGMIYFILLLILSALSAQGLTSGIRDGMTVLILCAGSGMLGGMMA